MPISNAAVVCPEPEAAQAGGVVLDEGGNAADAAIAAAYVQGVVNPLMCGIGGTGRMLIYQAADNKSMLINFGARAGSKARPDVYSDLEPSIFSNRYHAKNWDNYIGYKSILIPSFVRGTWDAHLRYGLLDWERILHPAIHYARDGFEIDEHRFLLWDPDRQRITDSPPPLVKLNATAECAKIYLKQGDVYQIGDRLVQSDHANTLKRIALNGADEFYTGEIASEIIKDFERNGALVTKEDLANCMTDFETPVNGWYKGFQVLTEGCPSMGSLEIEALHILEHIDIKKLGWRSVEYYNILARVFQTIYSDRSRYNADPRFVDVPEHLFLESSRAKRLADKIIKNPPRINTVMKSDLDETTHVSVVDRWGNGAAITHSNGNSAGVVTPGLGFLYNHHMHNFDPRPGKRNSIAPGKRPLFGCSPLMLLDNDHLKLISGSRSRYRVTAELQVLVDLLEFGAELEDAVKHYRIHAEYDPKTIYVEPSVPDGLKEGLIDLGWQCIVNNMDVPMCTLLCTKTGEVEAVPDPRAPGGVWLA